jgi:hypothetical protein
MPGLGGTFHHDGIRTLAAHLHDNGFRPNASVR